MNITGIVYPFMTRQKAQEKKFKGFPLLKPFKTVVSPFVKVGQTIVDKEKGTRLQRTNIGLFKCSLVKGTSIVESLDTFVFELPKIPVNLLHIALADFRRYPDREAMVFFCYSKKSGTYYLKYPRYTADKYGISYRDPISEDGEVVVLNLHSHHNLSIGANFSSIDDEDSFAPMIYGVAGHVSRLYPELNFRAATEGAFKYLSLEDIFDVPKEAA